MALPPSPPPPLAAGWSLLGAHYGCSNWASIAIFADAGHMRRRPEPLEALHTRRDAKGGRRVDEARELEGRVERGGAERAADTDGDAAELRLGKHRRGRIAVPADAYVA